MITKKLFNINKAIAVAELVIKFHQAVNKLIVLYSDNDDLLGPLLFNLKVQHESQLSIIKSARYDDVGRV